MEAPKFPSLFRNVKKAPRQFRYKPKHYSARSEQLAERKRAIEEQEHGCAIAKRMAPAQEWWRIHS